MLKMSMTIEEIRQKNVKCPFGYKCITDSSICGFLEYKDGKFICTLGLKKNKKVRG